MTFAKNAFQVQSGKVSQQIFHRRRAFSTPDRYQGGRVRGQAQAVESTAEESAPMDSDAPAVTEIPEVPEVPEVLEAPAVSEDIPQVQKDVTTEEKSPVQEPPQSPAKTVEQGEDLLGSLERSLEG
ncbi:MAG: hypothetical protein EOO38_32010 [Cytophagaceae bacterium]|nr:MAG: hypothetical protein EOO38_32010 [Cytophagaceae bacterium]